MNKKSTPKPAPPEPDQDSILVQTRIAPALYDKLVEEATREDRPVASFLRQILRERYA